MQGRKRRCAIATGILLMGLATGHAIAGSQQDPNIDDEFLGKASGLRYASDTDAFNPLNNDFASVDVGCGPDFWHQIGGGAGTFGQKSATYLASARGVDFGDTSDDFDDGVYASGYGPKGGTVTAYSICRNKGDGLKYRREEIPDAPDGERSGMVSCTGAKWRISSGSPFISPSESHANSSYPVDGPDNDKKPDDAWKGRVLDSAGGQGGFSMYGVCTREPLTYVRAKPKMVPSGAARKRTAGCVNAEQVVGGGVKVSGPIAEARLLESVPVDDTDPGALPDNGWRGGAYNDSGAAKKLTVYAICMG